MSDQSDKPAKRKPAGIKGLKKPEPWSFGGRGKKAQDGPQGKPMPDAERRRAMSRKVH